MEIMEFILVEKAKNCPFLKKICWRLQLACDYVSFNICTTRPSCAQRYLMKYKNIESHMLGVLVYL